MKRTRRERLRPLTERLSRLLATDDGTEILSVLQRLRLEMLAPSTEDASPEQGSLRLGVWDAELQPDGSVEFLRSEDCAEEWRYWADVERIPPKQGARVVLLGESVARGYLYDPAVTPARVLGAMLRVDVVDLARTDLVPGELPELAEALPALEPDAVVLFAGNNWLNAVLDAPEDMELLARAIRRDGFAACREAFLNDVVVKRCGNVLDRMAGILGALEIPVVVVVPEFNLADWRNEPTLLVPVLPKGRNVPWMAALEQAERALVEGRLEDVALHATEMIELDGGTSAVPHELLAKARPADARAHLEAARDAVCGLLLPHSPRCTSHVQELLRSKSSEHGFALVDLPRLFAEHRGGLLPDRALFLDYSHLTLEGIRVAMTEVAERLVPLIGDGAELQAAQIEIDPAEEAAAHFLAAIHNAHYGQSYEVIRHHCSAALDLAPSVSGLMLGFLDYQHGYAEPWMCKSFDEVARRPNVRRYLAPEGRRPMRRLADVILVEAIVDVLASHEIPLQEDGAPPGEPIDLLAGRHQSSTFREEGGYTFGPKPAYRRFFGLVSAFQLRCAAPAPLRLRLTCRVPSANGQSPPVEVRVNGAAIGELPASATWATAELEVPGAEIRAGANRIEIAWPLLEPRWEEQLERAARSLERGVRPDVLPVFGEVHALTAQL
ncbi:MAG: hypothetical protein AABM30_12895 [Actinomycetota bacterium]